MSIVSLADRLAAEDVMKAEKSESILRRQLPQPVLDDVSPCCNSRVDYSLGVGNPVCSGCGKPIYS